MIQPLRTGIKVDRYTRLITRGMRRITGPLRPVPFVLVVGAMRSGTTSLFSGLLAHPQVNKPSRKEIHFFDMNYHRGLNWYRSFFSVRTGVGIDNTPSYMVHSKSASRASLIMPDARIIALLRDPAERAWSHYRYRYIKRSGSIDLQDVVEADMARQTPALIDFKVLDEIPVLSAGLYARQLKPWIDLFGNERLLIVDSESLFERPIVELQRIQEFLELVPVEIPLPRRNAARPQEGRMIIEDLRRFYEEPNRELADLVDFRSSWIN